MDTQIYDKVYFAHGSKIEKYVRSHDVSLGYNFGGKEPTVDYNKLTIYIPTQEYNKLKEKERKSIEKYKDYKELTQLKYYLLVESFPDEEGKWTKSTETTEKPGYFGRPEKFVTVKYTRKSQEGGRRKQVKKQSKKNKHKSRSTRRR